MIAYTNANIDSCSTSWTNGNSDVWIIGDAGTGTAIKYRDDDMYCTYILGSVEYIDTYALTKRAINAERSKWIQREGHKIEFKPRIRPDLRKPVPVRRMMRCNNTRKTVNLEAWL